MNGTMSDRTLTVFWNEATLDHEAPDAEGKSEWSGRLAVRDSHPDQPDRVRNVRHIVEHELGDHTAFEAVEPATREQLERVHDPDYVDEVERFSANGGGRLIGTTGGNEATHRAATYAAGAAIRAAEHAVDEGPDSVPYALSRPSGHHAQPAQADGFCFYNNAAVAVEHAIETGRAERVAVLDWDVHHGNGTQECFYDRDDVLFVSFHHDHGSWHPVSHSQTGSAEETGAGEGEGYSLNVPLPLGTGDEGYAYAIDRFADPVIGEFDPDLLVVSAGQDPGTIDTLGRNVVSKAGFEALGRRAYDLAARHADGNLAVVQEGGYHVSHLAYATLGVLEGTLGVETGVEDPFAWLDEDVESARRAVDDAAAVHAASWPALER